MCNHKMFVRPYLPKITRRFIQNHTFNYLPKERLSPNELLWNVVEKSTIKCTQDWKNVRNEILNSNRRISLANIDAITVGICTSKKKYELAMSYLDFLKEENIELNLATLGKYFRLLYVKGVDEALSQGHQEQILGLYDNVRKSNPILDSITLENIVQALSLTREWKLCFELLDEIKITSSPSSYAYSAVVAASFLNNADELAWKILNEMIEKDKAIQETVYTSYFKRVAKSPEMLKEVEKMFNFMQTNCVKIEPSSTEGFVKSLKELQLTVHSSEVRHSGFCKCCNKKLESFDLTETEFSDLKIKIVQNVIVGKDVYNRTTSDELKKFKDFTSHMDRFDVIIDGLNVAYSVGVKQPPYVTSGLVSSVVSHFVNEGKNVLVLGRKHMNNWPKQNMGYIQQNATVFLTENLSQDDPYLLYCALNSGKDTIIVTRDLMRSHKFLLKDVHLKFLFDRWLSQRQYLLVRVQAKGNPIFKKPLPFSHIAQKNDEYWHVPCMSRGTVPPINTQWLCVNFKCN